MQTRMNSFHDMYVAELQELHSVETQLLDALRKAAGMTQHAELRQALDGHRRQTEQHRQRIEGILSRHGADPREHVDQAMQGLIRETEKMAGMIGDADLRDAALIASAQKIEHYEIAAYGTAATFAGLMGHEEDRRALHETLAEEKATDEKLTAVAERLVNRDAAGDQAGMEGRGDGAASHGGRAAAGGAGVRSGLQTGGTTPSGSPQAGSGAIGTPGGSAAPHDRRH